MSTDPNVIEKLILDELFSNISDDLGLILSSEIFCLNEHKKSVSGIKNAWRISLFNSRLFDVSEEKTGLDALGETWLSSLVEINDTISIGYLLANKIDVNLVSRKGFTALEQACRRGYKEAAELLIHAGADLDRQATHGSPILLALINKQYGMVKFLIDKMANLFFKDEHGYDILDHAISLKKTDIIEYILRKINLQTAGENIETLEFLMKSQELHDGLLLPDIMKKHFNKILENTSITDEKKDNILRIYIIIRENEHRKIRSEYNSRAAQFFNFRSSNYGAKIQAAKAILNQEEDWQSLCALKSGRLEKIAALFCGTEEAKTKRSTCP